MTHYSISDSNKAKTALLIFALLLYGSGFISNNFAETNISPSIEADSFELSADFQVDTDTDDKSSCIFLKLPSLSPPNCFVSQTLFSLDPPHPFQLSILTIRAPPVNLLSI